MSNMIEVKTSELSGAALRYAVAVACGWKLQRIDDGNWKEGGPHWWQAINEKAVVPGKRNGLVGYIKPGANGVTSGYDYCPDVDWSQGGPLIEKYSVSVDIRPLSRRWDAYCSGWANDCDTPLIAACRAIVAAKLGDTVSVPAELLNHA